MNPIHREAARSAGLHLSQELWNLGQELTHTFCSARTSAELETVLPAALAVTAPALQRARSGAGSREHAAPLITWTYVSGCFEFSSRFHPCAQP